MDAATATVPRPASTSRPKTGQWGTWMPDEAGREVFIENEDRARRRSRVLCQLQEARRRRSARGLR
jgi:hypothetical protein